MVHFLADVLTIVLFFAMQEIWLMFPLSLTLTSSIIEKKFCCIVFWLCDTRTVVRILKWHFFFNFFFCVILPHLCQRIFKWQCFTSDCLLNEHTDGSNVSFSFLLSIFWIFLHSCVVKPFVPHMPFFFSLAFKEFQMSALLGWNFAISLEPNAVRRVCPLLMSLLKIHEKCGKIQKFKNSNVEIGQHIELSSNLKWKFAETESMVLLHMHAKSTGCSQQWESRWLLNQHALSSLAISGVEIALWRELLLPSMSVSFLCFAAVLAGIFQQCCAVCKPPSPATESVAALKRCLVSQQSHPVS